MKATAAPLAIDDPPPLARRALVRVLVVDRDPVTRDELAAWFGDDPRVDVEAFGSAEQALNQSSGNSFDLCLLDWALDGVDGVMLGAMIRALNPGAQLVLTSEAVNGRLVRQATEHGFQSVIAKPCPTRDLKCLLETITRDRPRP